MIDLVLLPLLTLMFGGTVYIWVMAIASGFSLRTARHGAGDTRFAIIVPAHDEAHVIGDTVGVLQGQRYSAERFTVYVVADHCSDDTAAVAYAAGAVALSRNEGTRGSKGAALSWLIGRVFERDPSIDAFVVFDADTRVDPAYLSIVDGYLAEGAMVVQGRHAISNPCDGAYAALHDAMMRIDNRVGNQGRVNLGLSAKHMGDAITFRSPIIRRYWRESGLTEDYALRQLLLLEGIRIDYAPDAVGWGEAPMTWEIAREQRLRWLSGTRESNHRYGWRLLASAFRSRSRIQLDGALQALLPAYSSLVLFSSIGLGASQITRSPTMPLWSGVLVLLGVYPFYGLAIDRAPLRVWRALLFGPAFILWRSVLALLARIPGRKFGWVRTPRRSV